MAEGYASYRPACHLIQELAGGISVSAGGRVPRADRTDLIERRLTEVVVERLLEASLRSPAVGSEDGLEFVWAEVFAAGMLERAPRQVLRAPGADDLPCR